MGELKLSSIKLDKNTPVLLLDLDVLKRNCSYYFKNSKTLNIRVATKSIRSLEVLKIIQNGLGEKFSGLMAYDLREAIWLVDQGFEDVLLGYPQFYKNDLKRIQENDLYRKSITLMVDSIEHMAELKEFKGLQICVDVDMSYYLPGLYFCVFRSSKRHIRELVELVKVIRESSHNLMGFMGYEAQLAGVADKKGILSPIVYFLKMLSKNHILNLRKQIKNEFPKTKFFNGGGTGSIHFSSEDPSISEVTVGSGFFHSHLFDGYSDLLSSPSLFFRLPVTRRPNHTTITCLGGGYISSGEVGRDKLPKIIYPDGLEYISNEMAGEVQTPLRDSNQTLRIGDYVYFRPAKSGEICERFSEIHLLKNGEVIDQAFTYRGEGQCFY